MVPALVSATQARDSNLSRMEWSLLGHYESNKRQKSEDFVMAEAKDNVISPFARAPLDVILEICTHAHPKDLIRLAKTSKGLFQTLTVRSGSSTWRAARQNAGAPDGPSDMSELRWCILMFGETCCQILGCDRKDVRDTSFAFRLRICETCKTDKLVKPTARNYKTNYPKYDKSFLEMIPCTDDQYGRHYVNYWKPEMKEVDKQIEIYNDEIQSKVPGADQILEDYKSARKALAKEIKSKMDAFVSFEEQLRKEESDARIAKRVSQISDLFIDDGFMRQDFEDLLDRYPANEDEELTDRGWINLMEELGPQVRSCQYTRLEKEQDILVEQRKAILDVLYRSFKESFFGPTTWAFLPPLHEVCRFAPFCNLIWSSNDYDIGTDEFQEPMMMLMELIADWTEMRREILTAEINTAKEKTKVKAEEDANKDKAAPAGDAMDEDRRPVNCGVSQATINRLGRKLAGFSPGVNTSTSAIQPLPKETDVVLADLVTSVAKCATISLDSSSGEISVSAIQPLPDQSAVDPLNLATSVFKCTSTTLCYIHANRYAAAHDRFIGWDMAGAHHCRPSGKPYPDMLETRLQICERGSSAAALLVVSAGLDVETTTIAKMDEKDLRFICSSCPFEDTDRKPNQIQAVFTWRAAIHHYVSRTHDHCGQPSWDVLDTQQAMNVKALEGPSLEMDADVWSCNHCFGYLDNLTSWSTIRDHLEDRHMIMGAKVPDDMFVDPSKRWMKFKTIAIPRSKGKARETQV